MRHLSLLEPSKRLIFYVGVQLCLFSGLGPFMIHAALPKAETVVLQGDEQKLKVTNEKGQVISGRPALFSIFLGNRFSLPDSTAAANTKTFAEANILRTSEVTYRSVGATLNTADFKPGIEPALRIEYELPLWQKFSAHFSVEGGFTTAKDTVTSTGPFRYLNDQANAVELKDLTYSGTLTVTERRQYVMPMLGIGTELASDGMRKANDLRFLVRVYGGVALENARRNYDLALNPQYVTTAANSAYSDTYVIKSSVTQSYSMAVFAAGRVELGLRMRLAGRAHLALLGSMAVLYGIAPFDTVGTFTEQAGQKTVYQKVITGVSDEDSFRLIPGVFLALSMEL